MTKEEVNYQKYADQISAAYEPALPYFTPKHQLHYYLRKWRIDHDRKYTQPIFQNFQWLTIRHFPKLVKLEDQDYLARKLATSTPDASLIKGKRSRRKQLVYAQNPGIVFWGNITKYLFSCWTFSLHQHPDFAPYYQKALAVLKAINFEEEFFVDEMVRYNSLGLANRVYYSQAIGAHNLEDKLINTIKHFWEDKNDPKLLVDKVYAFTHIIIAATYYYQRRPKLDNYQFILDYFEKNFKSITQATNADVVAEVGLCFRLLGQHDHPVVTKARDHVIAMLDSEQGIVKSEKRSILSLQKLEHRNILAIMLLSDWDKTNLGPNLPVFMKERKRSLYLPKRGAFIK